MIPGRRQLPDNFQPPNAGFGKGFVEFLNARTLACRLVGIPSIVGAGLRLAPTDFSYARSHRILAGLSVALALAMLSSKDYAAPPASDWGRPVIAVRMDCDAPLRLEDFGNKITQKVGEPLSPLRVDESLKNLYASGRFVELQAEARPADGGVELVFVGRARFFVGVVRVVGTPGPLDPRLLLDAASLRLGQPLSEEGVAEAQERLRSTLAQNGYYQARVEHRVARNSGNQEADVVFSVVPGDPARLNGVEFDGYTGVPPERLKHIAGWRSGHPLTAARVERGLFKIHQFYVRSGWPLATASLSKQTHNPRDNTEKLLIQVGAGPRFKVRVEGIRLSESKIRELIPIFAEGVLDDETLAQGQQNLESSLERQGYFRPEIKVDRKSAPDHSSVEVTYTVIPGPRGEFDGYTFRGSREVRNADLASVMTLEPKSVFHPVGVFTRKLLARDVDGLKYLYQRRGFLEARVTPDLTDHYENHPGRFFVTFDIEEGPGSRVRQLGLRGVDEKTEKDLWPLLLSKPGQPYSPSLAESDRDAILGYLTDRGHTRAALTWTATPVSGTHAFDLEYRIDPGPQEKVRRVVVMGNQHARGGIIQRELLLNPGGPLSQNDILESERRLYDLGIFNQVHVAAQDPESTDSEKTVLVNVEEAHRWTLGYGGGFEVQRLGGNQPEGQFKASPRISFDLTRLNVDGRAQTLSLRGRLSTLEKDGAVGYLVPFLRGRRDLSLRLNALVDHSRDVLTFAAEREEASVSLEKRHSPASLLSARLSYRRVLVDPSTLRISPDKIPLLSRPARVGMFDASYVNDRRDDPADAAQGSYSLLDAGVSSDKLGSEANFLRLSGQNSAYHHLGHHLIFARSTRLAVEHPFKNTEEVLITEGGQTRQATVTREIPLPERFFMGGSDSHRGFSINQAGSRDPVTGFPIGGNALFLNSLELRMALREKRLGFVVFHDAGNVFSSFGRIRLLKVAQSSPQDFNYTSHAVGLGVRYKTPAGPLRFDVGYNLNPPRFQVSVPGGVEVRRLSQFQFFLSIGQSF